MSLEVEDIKYERELNARRHKEIKNTLKALAESLSKNNNEEIVTAIEGQVEFIVKGFEESIAKINISIPSVNLEVHQDKVVAAILEMKSEIKRELIELTGAINILNQTRSWTFTVNTDPVTQKITTIVATMNYIKPKYQA